MIAVILEPHSEKQKMKASPVLKLEMIPEFSPVSTSTPDFPLADSTRQRTEKSQRKKALE